MDDPYPGITKSEEYIKRLKEAGITATLEYSLTSAFVCIPAEELEKKLKIHIDKKSEVQIGTTVDFPSHLPAKIVKRRWLLYPDRAFNEAELFLVNNNEVYSEDFIKLAEEKSRAS